MDLLDYDDKELQEVKNKYESACPSIFKTLYVSALDGDGLDILKVQLVLIIIILCVDEKRFPNI